MKILDKVFHHPELLKDPPVLMDVGASSGMNPQWKALARYSICLAFDPDDREMSATRQQASAYKQLYVFDRAVTDQPVASSTVYLTQDAPCSSLLPPDPAGLAPWEFCNRFAVVKQSTIPTIQLQTV